MNYLFWNSRGAGGRTLTPLLTELRRQYSLSLIVILEPRQKGDKAEQMRRRIGFDKVAIIESLGFSGGIWVFWEKEAEFEVVEKHEQVLHGIIKEGLAMSVVFLLFMGVHRYKEDVNCGDSWRGLIILV